MPDRDIYNRHVPRGWQSASRCLFTIQDGEVLRSKVFRALVASIKQGGCPGIDQVANLIADALDRPGNETHLSQELKQRLDEIARWHANTRTIMAVEEARRILLDPIAKLSNMEDRERIRLDVARAFLVRLAQSNVSPQPLQAALLSADELSHIEYLQHIERVERLLIDSPEMNTLAARLLKAPSGEGLKTPRVHTTKLPMAELMAFHLTD